MCDSELSHTYLGRCWCQKTLSSRECGASCLQPAIICLNVNVFMECWTGWVQGVICAAACVTHPRGYCTSKPFRATQIEDSCGCILCIPGKKLLFLLRDLFSQDNCKHYSKLPHSTRDKNTLNMLYADSACPAIQVPATTIRYTALCA